MEKTGNYVDKLYEPIIINNKEFFAIYIEKNNTNKKHCPLNKNNKTPIGSK